MATSSISDTLPNPERQVNESDIASTTSNLPAAQPSLQLRLKARCMQIAMEALDRLDSDLGGQVEKFDTFTCFGRLPAGSSWYSLDQKLKQLADNTTEMRLKIWKHAEPDSRNVILRFRVIYGNSKSGLVLVAESRTPVPALLQVNQESRIEMQKTYVLSFAAEVPTQQHAHWTPARTTPNINVFSRDQMCPRIYFNFEKDILCWEADELQRFRPKVEGYFPLVDVQTHVDYPSCLGPDRLKVQNLRLLHYYRGGSLSRGSMLEWVLAIDRPMIDAQPLVDYVFCPDEKLPVDFEINENPDIGVFASMAKLIRYNFRQHRLPVLDWRVVGIRGGNLERMMMARK